MLNEFFLKTLEEEGRRLGIPADKKRALLREYLQTRIIAALYETGESSRMSFIGGTSLRLLRGLDRFSEDLDFDNLGLSFKQIRGMFRDIVFRLRREGFAVSYDMKNTDGAGIGDIRIEKLLFELRISAHRDEKLSVKINYTTPRRRPKTELVPLARFGFVQNVLTNTPEVMLAQKIRAIVQRKDPQPRDFYDIVWFLSRSIHPDNETLQEFGVKDEKEAFRKIGEIFKKTVQPNLSRYKARLLPFLINPDKIAYLDRFADVIGGRVSSHDS